MELTASQEDYLEAILALVRETGTARVRDIAARIDVAKPSVTLALRTLAKRDLVRYQPYGYATLTERGQAVAEQVQHRHKVLGDFFRNVLDVDEQVADANACRVEHAVSESVIRRLTCFAKFMARSSVPANRLPQAFREHCRQLPRRSTCRGCPLAPTRRRAVQDAGQGCKRSPRGAKQH
jgi:DtxR family Mn-dependent transcriptional regulator